MSLEVNTHPIAEILGRKLFGIDGVPKKEQIAMVKRAIKAAIKWAEKVEAERNRLKARVVDLEDALVQCRNAFPCLEESQVWHDVMEGKS